MFRHVQEYCAELLARAIEIERVKQHVAQVEARRGPLEGLSEDLGGSRLPHRMAEEIRLR